MENTKKTKYQQFGEDAINKMFEVAGYEHTFESLNLLTETEDWFMKYTWNLEQETTHKEWFIENYSKLFNVPKYKGRLSAEKNWMAFTLNYSLKRNDIDLSSPINEPIL